MQHERLSASPPIVEPSRRTAGILIPAFSVRRDGDLGIGDTLGLRQWIDWAADHLVGFLQLLPINENGIDESPYSAISSIAIDPIYLAIEHSELPWLPDDLIQESRGKLSQFLHLDKVNYKVVRPVKRQLLEKAWLLFRRADAELHAEFGRFVEEEKQWLEPYVSFRWLMEYHGDHLSWNQWPASCQTQNGADLFIAQKKAEDTKVGARLKFFAFVQWLCFRQWRALKAYADSRGVKLRGDLPIGVSWHSADAFYDRNQFHLELCGGSPPEPMVPDDKFFQQWGQNWGIPLYRWDRMETDGFAWWKSRVVRIAEIFRMFRIDHILGFYRIYSFPWAPFRNHEFVDLSPEQAAELTGGRLPRWSRRADDCPENEAANLADGDLRLRAILQANEDCEVIAEDLGWVPGYVRPHLLKLGIAGFRIPHWDSDHGHAITGDRFPECSFATYSTHDHDPINSIWRGCYDAIQRAVLDPSHENMRNAEHSRHALRILSEFAGIPLPANGAVPPFTDGVQWRLIKALFASNSRYAVLSVNELFDIPGRINRPGGAHAADNWTFRVPWTVEELDSDPRLVEIGNKLAATIGVTRRAH